MQRYANHEHPAIQALAKRLTGEADSDRSALKMLFFFVRDDVKFGFTSRWNDLTASQVLEAGVGHCTTKATLMHSLCKVAGIPSRLHFALVDTDIMRGLVSKPMMLPMPRHVSHSWTEVEIDGRWRRLDSYIFDLDTFEGCRAALAAAGWRHGFGVSPYEGRLSCDFNIDEEGFVQMGAVAGDHGVWDEPGDYFASNDYASFNAFQMLGFRMLVGGINRKIDRLRTGSR
jgi:hypothetical protein